MGLFDFLKKKPTVSSEVIIAADKEDETAKRQLHIAFEQGLTSDEHNALRKKAYYPLAVNGDANAQYWMGFLCLYCDKNPKEALYWYEKSASQGDTESMRALALGYSEYVNDPENSYAGCIGFGFDAQKERYWITKAAESGDYKAQVDLALDYKIENNSEMAIRWYSKALQSTDCKVLVQAYKGMADIYGCMLDKNYYNPEKQKEYLIRILEMKQNNVNDIGAYDEIAYSSAAFSLASLFFNEYKRTNDFSILRKSVYCFSLSYISGNEFSKEYITNSGYKISDIEWQTWVKHAKTLSFYLPN